jgi:hypothetical protein
MKLRSQKENAYSAGHLNIKHSGAQNAHGPTSPKMLLLQEMENKSNTSGTSIINIQKTTS